MPLPLPTPEQTDAIERPGRFVLRACPGSGKTLTVAHRVAKRVGEWTLPHAGLAALSFTNVACEEIRVMLGLLGAEKAFEEPHYIGTIDSFINRFIFLPFGHRVMNCSERPIVVGFGERPWSQTGAWAWGAKECNRGCNLTHFSWDLSGTAVDIRSTPWKCQLNHTRCSAMKKRFAKAGFATQTDAAYWAVRVLEAYPWIAKAVVRRFPEVLVDEAQDTSHSQMRTIDLLVEAGLKEVVLVGDQDQAIYEWRTAHPELFIKKASAPDWEAPSVLTVNMRSSQAICDATYPFSTLSVAARGRQDHRRPVIWTYDEESPDALIPRFVSFCRSMGVEPTAKNTAVLVRGRTLLRRILQLSEHVDPWSVSNPATKLLASAAWHREQRRPKEARRALEAALVYLLGGDWKASKLKDLVEVFGRPAAVGATLQRLMNRVPATSFPLKVWMLTTRDVFQAWADTTPWLFPAESADTIGAKKHRIVKGKKGQKAKYAKDFLDWPVASFFDAPVSPQPIIVETIHAAKGKTYDAVLLALSRHPPCTPKRLSEAGPDSEELRTAYVAMTRPRSILVVAMPVGIKTQYLARFNAFVVEPG